MKISIGSRLRFHNSDLYLVEDFSISIEDTEWESWVDLLNLDTQERSKIRIEVLKFLLVSGDLYPVEIEPFMKTYHEKVLNEHLSRL